jgi:hypothetical protein
VAARSGKWFCVVEAPSLNFCKRVKFISLSQQMYSATVKCLALRRTQMFMFGDFIKCYVKHNTIVSFRSRL